MLIAQKRWGEAYLRMAKTNEFRFHGRQWLRNRLGLPGAFSWYGSKEERILMEFRYPKCHMRNLYGSFATLDLFWEAFAADPEWASGFYTNDGMRASDLQNFKDFVEKHAKKCKGSQCVWFAPQPVAPVLYNAFLCIALSPLDLSTSRPLDVFICIHMYSYVFIFIHIYLWKCNRLF